MSVILTEIRSICPICRKPCMTNEDVELVEDRDGAMGAAHGDCIDDDLAGPPMKVTSNG